MILAKDGNFKEAKPQEKKKGWRNNGMEKAENKVDIPDPEV